MTQILSIDELKKLATPVIDIPDFTGKGIIKVRVQKPRLMALAAHGKLPNALMSEASKMVGSKSSKGQKKDFDHLKQSAKMMSFFCQACLVEPDYEDFKEIMTDEQMMAIFNWAMGGVEELEAFRPDKEDGTSNSNGQQVPGETQ